MMPSAPAAAAARLQRLHQRAAAGRVARVDDHREVRELLEHRHGGEVEREAVGRLERADAALAEQHVRVALLEDVLRRHQQLLERGAEAALEQHRQARAADLAQQRVVLHVAGAELDHVGDLGDRLDVARVHQLGDDRQPGLGLGLGEQAQALLPEALEGVRARARLVGAAAEEARAARGDRARRGHDLVARLDRARPGDEAEVVAADLAPVDLDDRALVRAQLGGGELERLQDRDDLGDAVVALEAEAGDVLAVADGADHRHLLPARGMRSSAAGLDAGDDGLHLLLGGRRLHHDHHGTAVLLGSGTWVTADGAALGPGARLPDGGGCGPRRPSA